jgi:hypothetical protein
MRRWTYGGWQGEREAREALQADGLDIPALETSHSLRKQPLERASVLFLQGCDRLWILHLSAVHKLGNGF